MAGAQELRSRFDDLRRVAVDASSIIYMLKAGFLGLLGHTIGLLTIQAVGAETGWALPELEIVPEGERAEGTNEDPAAISNDDRLLQFAANMGLPVVSDDRELLRGAAALGLEYYNSLMMLLFLRYRRRIDDGWYAEAYERLLQEGRYGENVLAQYRSYCLELGFED